MRFPALLACLVASSAWLAGCTPAPKPVLAVQWAGGHLEMSTVLCPGGSVVGAMVYDETQDSSIGHRWWVAAPASDRTETITAFEVPDGWTLKDHSLRELLPGVTYEASVDTVGAGDREGMVSFTLESLRGLKSGQLLVSQGHGSKVEDRAAFEKEAGSSC
ncbi:hypothetical protein [Peterkaempfera sp. SMS 1(5)a]|uniref:hypothetical protein n=1 Tax=Peterkaempfera podocarpi TaxID=3232308 RepID=UPI00366C19F8